MSVILEVAILRLLQDEDDHHKQGRIFFCGNVLDAGNHIISIG